MNFTSELARTGADVQTLVAVPTAEEAATWRQNVVVVIEGLFLHVDRVNPRTGYYNVVNVILPHILRYVHAPLRSAGRKVTILIDLTE